MITKAVLKRELNNRDKVIKNKDAELEKCRSGNTGCSYVCTPSRVNPETGETIEKGSCHYECGSDDSESHAGISLSGNPRGGGGNIPGGGGGNIPRSQNDFKDLLKNNSSGSTQ